MESKNNTKNTSEKELAFPFDFVKVIEWSQVTSVCYETSVVFSGSTFTDRGLVI